MGTNGNDSFDQIGILDTVSSGRGDDTITISSAFFESIDGGTGTDTLELDILNNFTLDLTNRERRLEDVEIIDMQTGTGTTYTINLNLERIMEMSDRSSALTIDGDASDSINISGSSGDYTTNVEGGYTRYSYNVGDLSLIHI